MRIEKGQRQRQAGCSTGPQCRTVIADISSILVQLRDDHRNMAALLDVIEAQMLLIDAGETPNMELLRDVMRYMTDFADAIHHPKEDLVYAELRRSGGRAAMQLEAVDTDHLKLAEFSKSLRDDVEAIVAGAAVVTRERVLSDAARYVRRLRTHMRWEERELFPLAEALATTNPIRVELADDGSDPIFGATSEAAFRNLLTHLQQSMQD